MLISVNYKVLSERVSFGNLNPLFGSFLPPRPFELRNVEMGSTPTDAPQRAPQKASMGHWGLEYVLGWLLIPGVSQKGYG